MTFIIDLSYRVSELEVRNLKRLEMIEKPSIFCISCLYLQEYKKEFAFLTKFHYFESRGGLTWALKIQLKICSQTFGLTLKVFFLKIAYIHSKQWFKEKKLKKKIQNLQNNFFDPKGGPFASKKKWFFLKKILSFKIVQNDLKRYLKAKKSEKIFEIFWTF